MPNHYALAHEGESEEDYATRLADDLDRMIEAEGPETVGGFIAEPLVDEVVRVADDRRQRVDREVDLAPDGRDLERLGLLCGNHPPHVRQRTPVRGYRASGGAVLALS